MNGIRIPDSCGAILLNDCTLFPHGAVPLHIFEPRYREMLTESLQSHCMMCVATLLGKEQPDPGLCVSPIGTIGLIRASKELEDGRSNLLLHGLCRVRFEEWTPGSLYPSARIRPAVSQAVDTVELTPDVLKLVEVVDGILEPLPEEIRAQFETLFDKISNDPSALSDCIAQQFVEEPKARHRLLEELDVERRLKGLTAYLEQHASNN